MNLTEEQIIERVSNAYFQVFTAQEQKNTLELCGRNLNSNIVYLCFNASVEDEFSLKTSKKGFTHVKSSTIHKIAIRRIFKLGYKLAQYPSLSPYGIDVILGKIPKPNRQYPKDKILSHIHKYFEAFCISDEKEIYDFDYKSTLVEKKTILFFEQYERVIRKFASELWQKMVTKECDMVHSFYIKLYELGQYKIDSCDILIIDECQDLSALMISIIRNQTHIEKIIAVGDSHQKIYGFLGSADLFHEFKDLGFESFTLSNSFRFPQRIADLAMNILDCKFNFDESYSQNRIELKGVSQDTELALRHSFAVISRTNNGLFLYLIDNVEKYDSIFIFGGLDSLTKFDGFDIQDIIALDEERFNDIKNNTLKFQFKTIEDLQEYAEDTDSIALTRVFKLLDDVGNSRIKEIIKIIKSKITTDSKRADVTLTTAHKSKGLEFDEVEILEDFNAIPFKLEEEKTLPNGHVMILSDEDIERARKQLIEEVNLFYVACTRTKSKLRNPYNGYYSEKKQEEVKEKSIYEIRDDIMEKWISAPEVKEDREVLSLNVPKENPFGEPVPYESFFEDISKDKKELKKNIKLLARGKSLIFENVLSGERVLISRGKRYIEVQVIDENDSLSEIHNSLWSITTTLNVLSRKLKVYKKD